VSANIKSKLVPFWREEALADDEGKEKLTIKILGEEYTIRGPFSTEHMLKVGNYVNELMQDLTKKYSKISLQKIAVLACLNLASDLLLLRCEKENTGEKNNDLD
jgi:cell division protein ZapA